MSHSRWRPIPVLLAAGAVGSCTKSYDGGGAPPSLVNPVLIRVDGMQKGKGGKT